MDDTFALAARDYMAANPSLLSDPTFIEQLHASHTSLLANPGFSSHLASLIARQEATAAPSPSSDSPSTLLGSVVTAVIVTGTGIIHNPPSPTSVTPIASPPTPPSLASGISGSSVPAVRTAAPASTPTPRPSAITAPATPLLATQSPMPTPTESKTSHSTTALIGAIAGLVAAGMFALIGVYLFRYRRRHCKPRAVSITSDSPITLQPYPSQDVPNTTHLLSMFPDRPTFSDTAHPSAPKPKPNPNEHRAVDGGPVLPPQYDPRWGTERA